MSLPKTYEVLSTGALTSNKGNITIKWDLMNWTPDGYIVSLNKIFFEHEPLNHLCVSSGRGYSLQQPETTFNSFTWMENELEMGQKRGDIRYGAWLVHKPQSKEIVQCTKETSLNHVFLNQQSLICFLVLLTTSRSQTAAKAVF